MIQWPVSLFVSKSGKCEVLNLVFNNNIKDSFNNELPNCSTYLKYVVIQFLSPQILVSPVAKPKYSNFYL